MSELSNFVETALSVKSPASFAFKSDQLNAESALIGAATAKLLSVGENVKAAKEEFNRAVAPVLARIADGKLYKADGFKSVAEYAEQTFAINRSMTYLLARVGKRMQTLPELAEFTTSNAAELVNADGVAVRKGIASGEISSESTQQQLRDFAAAHPLKEAKPRIVPTFDIYNMDGSICARNVLKDDFARVIGHSHVFKVSVDGDSRTMYVGFTPSVSSATLFYTVPHVAERKASGTNQYAAIRKACPWMAAWTDKRIQAWIDAQAAANEDDAE